MLAVQLTLILVLSGCNMPGINLPQPVDTDPADTPTPPPSPTPTATPSPTPTPVPIEVIHDGERHLQNGDWDAAMLAFQNVIANPGASADERVQAEIGLARASLARGDFGSARGALDSLLAESPEHPRASQAYFLRGDANLGIGDYGAALQDYQIYLERNPGLIDTYVYERIGDTYLAIGQPEQALQAYEQAIASDRYLLGLLQLREKVATVHRSLGNADAAIAQYRAILESAQYASYRATIEFYIGQTLFEAERYDEAYAQFQTVFLTYPSSHEALSTLRALLEADYDVDQFQRGLVNYYQGQYDIAVAAFLNYLADTPIRDVSPSAHLFIAFSYRALGNNQAALSELEAMINRFGPDDGSAWGDAWLERADILAESGDPESAYAIYDELATEYSALPQAAEAIYQSAEWAEKLGDNERATGFYQRLATEYPDDARAAAGLFRTGLAFYQAGDFESAAALFTASTDLPVNERPAAAYLWLGKTRQAAGQAETATEALNMAIQADGETGYYALRAADLLSGQPPFTPPGALNLAANDSTDQAEAEQWLVEQFGLTETPPLADTLRADLASDPRMLRGRELWELGMKIEAKQDFESLRESFVSDPLASYQLALVYQEIGLYRSSILAARNIHRLAGIDPLDGPVFLARLRYPTYYDDLILPEAESYGIDPLFVYSLIWQESIFEGFAVSSAAAQGLMQIWPPTGEDIAAQIAWPNYQPSDLQRPYISVKFGTWLLNEEMARFNGDPYAVLTAYNAGPGNTATWKDLSGSDMDLFVEVITLREPQLYVRSIYEHYVNYRSLYGE